MLKLREKNVPSIKLLLMRIWSGQNSALIFNTIMVIFNPSVSPRLVTLEYKKIQHILSHSDYWSKDSTQVFWFRQLIRNCHSLLRLMMLYVRKYIILGVMIWSRIGNYQLIGERPCWRETWQDCNTKSSTEQWTEWSECQSAYQLGRYHNPQLFLCKMLLRCE